MPNTTLPNFDLSKVDFNKAAADINNAIKETAYIAIGLGVLGFQQAQLQGAELSKQINEQIEHLSTLPSDFSAQVDGYAKTARTQAEAARTQLLEQLQDLRKTVEEALAQAVSRINSVVPGELPKLPDFPDFPDLTVLNEQFDAVRTQLTEVAKSFDERVAPLRKQVDDQIDRIEQLVPAGARSVVQQVRTASAAPEQLFRNVVGLS